jgi:prevent-host-death family protein
MQVNLYDAKTHLSELVDAASKGEEVVIAKAGKPMAKLVALESRRPIRYGLMKGQITIAADFDAPLPDDVIDSFEGGTHP